MPSGCLLSQAGRAVYNPEQGFYLILRRQKWQKLSPPARAFKEKGMIASLNNAFIRATSHPDFGKLLLRLTFGILMLFHGVAKIEHGVDWISAMLIAKGLPGFIAYGVFIGEIVTPVMIIIGLYTRQAAFIYAFNLLVATLLVGMDKFFTLTKVGAWGLENEALYFLGGLCIMFLGAGKYALFGGKEK